MALTRRMEVEIAKKSPQCSYIVIMCQGKNEFLIIITASNINSANAAIKATR
jgi:hypothetical protein